jgi:UTP--glucose-1-phosphate uridylyltransferase
MRGLGDAVLCARPYLEGEASLLVALGDAVLAETSPGALARRLVDAPAPLALAVQRVAREKLSRYGIVATPPASAPITGGQGAAGETFPICGLVEKPAPEDAPSEWAVAARYKLPAAIFDALKRTPPGKGGEVQLTDAIAALLAAGTPADAVPLLPGEMRHDIGSFETYFKAFAAFALADPEHGASLRRFLEETLAMQHLPRAQEAA